MPTVITGTDGINQVQSGAVESGDLPAGSVIQVVQFVFTSQTTTTSTVFVDSGFSASITPHSNQNKILVSYTARHSTGSYDTTIYSTIYRNNAGLHSDNGMVQVSTDTIRPFVTTGASFLDSPSSASLLEYSLYFKTITDELAVLGRNGQETVITLMEIAG